jgi:hypothetical protein
MEEIETANDEHAAVSFAESIGSYASPNASAEADANAAASTAAANAMAGGVSGGLEGEFKLGEVMCGQWLQHFDASGNEYWVHQITGVSAWELPEGWENDAVIDAATPILPPADGDGEAQLAYNYQIGQVPLPTASTAVAVDFMKKSESYTIDL